MELKEFLVNGIGLKSIDARLFKLKNLVRLDLTRNNISKLPPRLFQLRLKVLTLADNVLTENSFPPKIKDCPLFGSLEKLDIRWGLKVLFLIVSQKILISTNRPPVPNGHIVQA